MYVYTHTYHVLDYSIDDAFGILIPYKVGFLEVALTQESRDDLSIDF